MNISRKLLEMCSKVLNGSTDNMNRIDKVMAEIKEEEDNGGYKVLKKYRKDDSSSAINPGDYLWPATPERRYPNGDTWDIVRGGTFFGNERIKLEPQQIQDFLKQGILRPTGE